MEKELSRHPAFPWMPLGILLLLAILVEYWVGFGWIIGAIALIAATSNLLATALTVRVFTDGKSFIVRKGSREDIISASEVIGIENAVIGPFMILRVQSPEEFGHSYTFLPRSDYSLNDAWGADVIDTIAKICGWTKR